MNTIHAVLCEDYGRLDASSIRNELLTEAGIRDVSCESTRNRLRIEYDPVHREPRAARRPDVPARAVRRAGSCRRGDRLVGAGASRQAARRLPVRPPPPRSRAMRAALRRRARAAPRRCPRRGAACCAARSQFLPRARDRSCRRARTRARSRRPSGGSAATPAAATSPAVTPARTAACIARTALPAASSRGSGVVAAASAQYP